MLDYYNALERIKKNKPNIIKKGCKITKASVAKEAGRDPSSIKSNRPGFTELIKEIQKVAKKRVDPLKELKVRYDKMKVSRDSYKLRYEEQVADALLLIRELNECKLDIKKLTINKFK